VRIAQATQLAAGFQHSPDNEVQLVRTWTIEQLLYPSLVSNSDCNRTYESGAKARKLRQAVHVLRSHFE